MTPPARPTAPSGRRDLPASASAPRILVLRHRPTPAVLYGGPVYTAAILGLLAGPPLGARLQESSFETAPWRPTRWLRDLFAATRSLGSPLPAKILRFRSWRFADRLRGLLARERFDLAVISGLEMMWCRAVIADRLPVLYLCHNLEAALYHQQIQRLPGPLRTLARRDADRLADFERREVGCSDAIATISERDRGVLADLAAGVPALTVPPVFTAPRWGGDTPADEDAPPLGKEQTGMMPIRLGFLGNLSWWPNLAALRWFLDSIWPQVPERFALHVFGRGSDHLPARPRLFGHGYVQSLDQVWGTADILIQPIVVAAGLNIKVAEALYHRRPMLVTPQAVDGCGLAPDPAIVIADGASAWIAFLRSPEPTSLARRRVCVANADRFSAARHAAPLAGFVRRVIDGRRANQHHDREIGHG